MSKKPIVKSTKKSVAKKVAGKTLADFRAIHDKSTVVPGKIKEGLVKLGKDGWDYEPEFVKLCGVSVTDFSRFREDFEDYYVIVGGTRTGKRVWAGSKELAAKMREMA